MKIAVGLLAGLFSAAVYAACPHDPACISNPHGAGNPYLADGIKNPYSQYGSPYSDKSVNNPFATDAPKLYQDGEYRGRLSTNRFEADSISNPYGQYGNSFSPDSLHNSFGAGNPFNPSPIYVVPQ